MPTTICYHAVSTRLESPLAVSEAVLRAQMQQLSSAGLRGVGFTELERRRRAGEDCDGLIGITFDDGYESTLLARDVLSEFDFTATVYVLPTLIGSRRPMRWPGIEEWSDGPLSGELVPMDWSGVESLATSGWEIGAHTLTHPQLPYVSDGQLEHELGESRRQLHERLGNCDSVAYPYGLADSRVAAAARDAGFDNGVTLTGWFMHDERFLRPRLGIYRSDGVTRYRIKRSAPMTALRSMPLMLPRRSS
jgi:peptidoglycan/xylan/chitin deacetylase (PgdA/CDA1 family)